MASPVLALILAGGLNFGSLGGLPFIFLAMVAMYFVLVVPNQRKQKQWQGMLAALKPGDKVTTSCGLRGKIVLVKDDSVIVRTEPDGMKLEFVKASISAVTTDEETVKA